MRILPILLGLSAAAIAQPTLPNAVPMPTPEIQYLDRTGKPLSGAKLCSYAAGTSTPLATYTDSTAATPNTNPIVLDSNGRASVWVGGQLYKFVLRVGGDGTCTTGAVQWSQDNVSDTSLYLANFVKTAGTSVLITYTAPGGGTTRTVSDKLSDAVSVKDFGALGDGVHDDTANIQSAINSLGTLTMTSPYLQPFSVTHVAGGTILFPTGTYKVTDTLKYASSMRFVGQRLGSLIVYSPTSLKHLFIADTTKYAWSGVVMETVSFENLFLLAGNANANDALHFLNTVKIALRDVRVRGFAGNGVYIGQAGGGSYYNLIENCDLWNNGHNLYLDTNANATQVIGGTLSDTADFTQDYNVIVKAAAAVSFFGTALEGHVTVAQVQDAGPATTFVGVYVEQPGGAGQKPLVERDMAAVSNFYGSGSMVGVFNPKILFKNFDQIASDSPQTVNVMPTSYEIGHPKWVDLIPNGRMTKGLYSFVQSFSNNNGTITYDAATKWGGFPSLKLTNNGAGGNGVLYTIPDTTAYIGRRLYITAVIKTDGASQTLQMQGFGAGNTLAKFDFDTRVDYGNGWGLYVLDMPIIDGTALTAVVLQTSAANGVAAWVTAFHAYVDGYPTIPWGAENKYLGTAIPAAGNWNLGDLFWNTTVNPIGPVAWINTTAGTPGTWRTIDDNTHNCVNVYPCTARQEINNVTAYTENFAPVNGDSVVRGSDIVPSLTQKGNVDIEMSGVAGGVGLGSTLSFSYNKWVLSRSYTATEGAVKVSKWNATNQDTRSSMDFYNSDSSALTRHFRIDPYGFVTYYALPLATITGGTVDQPPNGSMIYCSDCKNVVDNAVAAGAACVAGGAGTFARRENSAWRCN